jgi:hypothetical protein
MKVDEAKVRLRTLLEGQPLGVLSTSSDDSPHATLVAIASTKDLREVVFATSRETRKFAALRKNPRVALLVDDRSNEVRDFHDASVATAHGRASEIEGEDLVPVRDLYLNKHPYLSDFVRAPSCALVRIVVDTYDLVINFQEVHLFRIRDGLDSHD